MNCRNILIGIVFITGLSCQKDSLLDEPLYLKLNLNDTAFVKEYNPINGDMGHYYGFTSSRHVGTGFGAVFPIDSMRYLQFTFGQITMHYPQVSYDMFKSLFVVGEKRYDSLRGADNQVKTDCVEVDYRDAQGVRWSSTHLLYDNVNRKHTVHQPGSRFVVQEVRELNINGKQSIKIKGHFHCTLYEENGSRTKNVIVDKFVTQVVKY